MLRTFTGTREGRHRPPAPAGETTTRSVSRRRPCEHVEGHQPLLVGHALRRRHRVPGHDHVGGRAAARPRGADRALHRSHHRERRNQDARLHGRARSAAEGRRHHRGGPARAVPAVDARPRQGQRGEPGGDRHPQPARPDQPAAAEGAAAQESRDPEAGRRPDGAAHRGRGRGLPGEEPQRPGSAELSDPPEQQDRGARRA